MLALSVNNADLRVIVDNACELFLFHCLAPRKLYEASREHVQTNRHCDNPDQAHRQPDIGSRNFTKLNNTYLM